MLDWAALWPCARLQQKYALVAYLLHILHHALCAKKPRLYKQDNPVTARLLAKCSLLLETYHPSWFLFNGHMQTILVAMGCDAPQVKYKREILSLSDGGIVSLDWAQHPNGDTYGHDHPTVLLLHGLTGGSSEIYIRMTAVKLMQAGWRVVVMNARGCAKTPVVTAKLFCAAYTQDVRETVRYLREEHLPTAPLVAGGFSLGSNILLKYVGEEGESCLLTGAISVGNPYDLLASNRNLMHSWLHNLLYRSALTTNLVTLFFEKSNAHTHFVQHPAIDLNHLRSAQSVWDFDDRLTRHVFGYATVSDYYRDASCSQYLKHIRIPTLCLTAEDDPISIHTGIPYDDCEANRHIVLAVTERGGHLGFFTGGSVVAFPDMWASNVFVQFCNAVEDLASNAIPLERPGVSVLGRLFQPGIKPSSPGPTYDPSPCEAPCSTTAQWVCVTLALGLGAKAVYDRRSTLLGTRIGWY
ncbi:hypothetical protein SPRG_01139 [Saprolegnia parasitica CBS 223.65]|uniref:AB hydrolase-1 domain-containing protein n=1 Tax=Saprolegnia parasitica (strain CBS 223.65) TaxID=695850 RepID=A0A067D0Q0_SAPPC|nr:hypothetical protein SPRG_01139 [Saprolegnia parasitica CBS 223.65]KDO35075.1 hypothetical protein SPRG_01139 [Saprolegnia parasitica CBS 223.65]|eukprot:XP_012194728.1 hypothetical protein SPRG_01139 [Saprolegnia parasitica CBS 223.65]